MWASNGSPGPKFAAGTPRAVKKLTSVQPSFARGGVPLDATKEASSGWPRFGAAASDAVLELDVIAQL